MVEVEIAGLMPVGCGVLFNFARFAPPCCAHSPQREPGPLTPDERFQTLCLHRTDINPLNQLWSTGHGKIIKDVLWNHETALT